MPTAATAAWHDPQLSIGQISAIIKRKTIWEATGPALDKFENQIFQAISKLLETHKDHLEEGEEIARTYSFHLWMVGKDAQSARPTIIFTCKSAKFRTKVIKLIKKHDILGEFPGFTLNSMDRMPAVPMGPQLDAEDNWLPDMEETVVIGATVYARGIPIDVCGALVSIGDDNETTLGGVILVGDSYYGIIALHPRLDGDSDSDSILCKHGDLRFDDDSDATSSANVSLRTSLAATTKVGCSILNVKVAAKLRRKKLFIKTLRYRGGSECIYPKRSALWNLSHFRPSLQDTK
ncbi:hypothetical protein BKA65DRAFT_42317 [Rhexocercosporidium sp. MPI-PUGE-AT-0058]|nr:hypothetical protein BKA65DRAFT_42317 [Rhexocercosporidium sp. MPI-PUGE-AT-0058]